MVRVYPTAPRGRHWRIPIPIPRGIRRSEPFVTVGATGPCGNQGKSTRHNTRRRRVLARLMGLEPGFARAFGATRPARTRTVNSLTRSGRVLSSMRTVKRVAPNGSIPSAWRAAPLPPARTRTAPGVLRAWRVPSPSLRLPPPTIRRSPYPPTNFVVGCWPPRPRLRAPATLRRESISCKNHRSRSPRLRRPSPEVGVRPTPWPDCDCPARVPPRRHLIHLHPMHRTKQHNPVRPAGADRHQRLTVDTAGITPAIAKPG